MRMNLIYLMGGLALFISACTDIIKKKTNWTVTLDKEDKKPYGSYLAYQSLKYFYPQTKISDLSRGFRYSSIDEKMIYDQEGKALLVAVGLDFYLTQTELGQLIAFVEEGNELVVFSRVLDEKLENLLLCTIKDNGYEEAALTRTNDGKTNRAALTLTDTTRQFGYQGKSLLASYRFAKVEADTTEAEAEDTTEYQEGPANLGVTLTDTLGYVKGEPNFIRYKIGDGHLTLHSAPLAMSNYFLLQEDNRKYLEGIWQTLPDGITRIYWNDYFKRSTEASDIGVLLKYPATRWAFILALFALLVYLIFEGKRKQKIIPVVTPLENSSVSFVETVGRLYYNKADHSNIAEKMVQHFLEWVRTHYFINTNRLDDNFKAQLQLKSGLSESVIISLMEMIREVHIERKAIDETELYHLHNTIQQFYKNNK